MDKILGVILVHMVRSGPPGLYGETTSQKELKGKVDGFLMNKKP